MLDLINKAKDYLSLVGPILIFGIAIISTWSIIKWSKRVALASKEVFSSPFSVLFFLVILSLLGFFYFKYVSPLL